MSTPFAFNNITVDVLRTIWPDVNGTTRRVVIEVMDAINAVRNTPGGWEFIKTFQDERGFMFSRQPKLAEINSKIDADGTIGHSGESYAVTMRYVEGIIKGRI
jgi:hypothetical protein